MESYLLDWANLLLRWVHVITAIAWIGSSFYFVFLDSSLTPPVDEDLKSRASAASCGPCMAAASTTRSNLPVSPPQLPAHLHWFYWESYSTWLSGFALFTVSYLWSASTYLIDKSVMDWSPGAAIAVALSFLVVFWLLYDAICRSSGSARMATPSSARWCWCWCAWLLAGLPLVCRARRLFAGGRHDGHQP
jgi:uncharacterized membrane protein